MEETSTHGMSIMDPGSAYVISLDNYMSLYICEEAKKYSIKDENNSSAHELLVW